MDDSRTGILNSSGSMITRLQLLSVFFEDELVYKIHVRTQVIHKLFENNTELDIHKLELFHLQFTDTIIALLKRIKKSNEKNVVLAEDEIQLNEELIEKITHSMRLEENFFHARQVQAIAVNQSLQRLYRNLSNISAEVPIPKTIVQFGNRYAKDFFYEIENSLFAELVSYDSQKVYRNGYGIIEKHLMGLQCKHGFSNEFYCGLKAGNWMLEVYRFAGEETFFLFYPQKNLFLQFDPARIAGIDLTAGISKNARIIQDLAAKNTVLKNSLQAVKTNIPPNILELLTEYYNKIASMDFLDFIDDFDVQANILKTMLNTESI